MRAVLGLSLASRPVRPAQRADEDRHPRRKTKRSSVMSMTCFPYGFPTGYATSPRGSSRIWPRCTNAEPGSYGHECGEPAGFIGSRADGGQSCFCSACKAQGSEARRYSDWQALRTMGQGGSAAKAHAFTITLPGDAGSDWTVHTWASTAEQAARQVCDWQGIPTHFVRAVRPDE